MSDNNLLIEVSPPLLEALNLPSQSGRLDYFSFLGLSRGATDPTGVKRAVMERSKALRLWQNSPVHGEEAVRLLPLIQRVGRVLGEDARREAYCRELDRMLSGSRSDAREELGEMIVAASAGGAIAEGVRQELFRFAESNGIPQDEAEGMIARAGAPPAAPTPAPVSASRWDEMAASGTNGAGGGGILRALALERLRTTGLGDAARRELAADAVARGIAESEIAEILRSAAVEWFRGIIRPVAARGVLTDNQARLLIPRAREAGLGADEAYEIVSEYTFTSASKSDLATMQLTLRTFDPADIEAMLEPAQDSVQFVRRHDSLLTLAEAARGSRWLRRGIAALVILALGAGGWFLFRPSDGPGPGTSQMDEFERVARNLSAAPEETAPPPEDSTPDPPSGRLNIPWRGPADPPDFEVAITEVTCAEYQSFINDVLYTRRPEGWGVDFSHPSGWENRPVTGIAWKDAMAFCKWKARKLGVAEERVRLPTRDEYLRMLDGGSQEAKSPGESGRISPAGLWNERGMSTLRWMKEVRDNRTRDAIRTAGGRIYDLLGNVSEWGADEAPDGRRAVLGGNFSIRSGEFDPAAERYEDPESSAADIGFRYVVASE